MWWEAYTGAATTRIWSTAWNNVDARDFVTAAQHLCIQGPHRAVGITWHDYCWYILSDQLLVKSIKTYCTSAFFQNENPVGPLNLAHWLIYSSAWKYLTLTKCSPTYTSVQVTESSCTLALPRPPVFIHLCSPSSFSQDICSSLHS